MKITVWHSMARLADRLLAFAEKTSMGVLLFAAVCDTLDRRGPSESVPEDAA